MIIVDEKERSYIQRDSRTFYARILCDGEELSGVLRSYTQYKGSCGSSTFQPQSIFSSYADINMDYCKKGIVGKKITLQNGIKLGGVEYWHTVGTYYVNKAPVKGNKTTIEALGVISAKLGKKFTGGTYSTVSSLVARLEEIAGCSIILENGMEDLTLPATDLSDYYCREVLGLIAGLYLGYATEDVDGNIVIKTYNEYSDNTLTAYPSRMARDPEIYEEATVQGIQVIGSDDTEILVGDLQNCSITNPLVTPTTLTDYALNYISFKYEPFEIEMTLGDFTIEPWDIINVTDRTGVSHSLIPMSIKHTFDGGIKTVVSAPILETGEDRAREEITMQANTSYNKVVSGNIQANTGNTGGGGSAPAVAAYPVTGEGVSGYLYIENGQRVFGTLHITITEGDTVGASSVGFSSYAQDAIVSHTYITDENGRTTLYFNKPLSIPYSDPLGPTYVNELNGLHVMIPTFTYNGTTYTGAGALNAWVTLNLNSDSRSLSYVLNFATDYMKEQLGELYMIDSTDWREKSLIGASFDIHFTYLISASREWEYSNSN